MEARATFKQTSVSRLFVVAILALVALGLGAMGGYFARGAGAASTGAPQVVRPVQFSRAQHEDPALPAADTSAIRGVKGGTHGDHGDLP